MEVPSQYGRFQYHIFSPYRVCPLGAHVDHQHGLVTGFAIDKGVEWICGLILRTRISRMTRINGQMVMCI